MSYFIGHIIYGIPGTDDFQTSLLKEGIPEGMELYCKEFGLTNGEDLHEHLFGDGGIFDTAYSGSADHTPSWLGVKIGEFDECTDFIPMERVNLTPTIQQKAMAEKKIEELPEALRKRLPPVGMYIVPATS